MTEAKVGETDPVAQPVGQTDPETPSDEQDSFPWDPKLEGVLENWRLRAWAGQTAHYKVASELRRHNVLLGLPVVILTTVVGTSLFASTRTGWPSR